MNIFIDAGAFHGLYIRRFKDGIYYKPRTKIYAFECNPTLKNVTYGQDVTTIRKAIWIFNGNIPFYLSKRNPEKVQGSSVFGEKITGNLDKDNPVDVECIDFSQFLYENVSGNDNLIVKMNIEGAEYAVLEKLLFDNTLNIIDELHIQWHSHKIGMEKEKHESIKSAVEEQINVHSGFGRLNKKRG